MLFPFVALTAVFAIATGTAIEPVKQVEEDSGVATEKAAALPPPATTDGGHEEEVRRMLKRTAAEKAAAKAAKAAAKAEKAEAEKAEAALIASGGSSGGLGSITSNIFEKLGFCNTKTLRGRYTFFSNGNGNLSPEFARDPDAVVDPAGPVGPIAISGFTYFDGKGNAFSEISSRPDSGSGALGPLVIFDLWSKYDVLKNCSNLLKGDVRGACPHHPCHYPLLRRKRGARRPRQCLHHFRYGTRCGVLWRSEASRQVCHPSRKL